MAKIEINEETSYVIRCYLPEDDLEEEPPLYYQSPNHWEMSPYDATIFRSFDVAEIHMIAAHNFNGDDGSVMDISPLYGEIRQFERFLAKPD